MFENVRVIQCLDADASYFSVFCGVFDFFEDCFGWKSWPRDSGEQFRVAAAGSCLRAKAAVRETLSSFVRHQVNGCGFSVKLAF
jgi:hypothetical protein